jgi:hypothetical protein
MNLSFGTLFSGTMRGDEELVTIAAFSHEEATGSCSKRCGLGRDGETEWVSKMVANIYIWVGGEDRWEELGTGGLGDEQLANFEVNIW